MAGLPVAGVPMSSGVAKAASQQATSASPNVGNPGGIGSTKYFQEEGRVREVLQQLQSRLVNAQQLSMAISQQPPSSTNTISSGSTGQQIALAEEINKRLVEAMSKLQEAAQDFSLAGLQERFSAMAVNLNLKFDIQHSKPSEKCSFFLACDAFYVEICCQDNGRVNCVKIAQANKQVDCEVLTQLASKNKFQQLQCHLRSLVDFYSQGGGPNCEHSNMYYVITSLESMLLSITKMMSQNILSEVILTNPLGHVIPRSGGLPMKLIFFVHPSDVLRSPARYHSHLCDRDYLQQEDDQELGVSASLSLQSSEKVYPLSIDPHLFDVSQATFFPLTPQKTVTVSASYVLQLSKELAVSGASKKELHNVMFAPDQYQPLVGPHINQLIMREDARSKGEAVPSSKTRVVCLPNQRHHYYLPSELLSHDQSQDQSYPPSDCGCMMSNIPFLHPVHIFNLVTLLRKQLVYNTLVSSVICRRNKTLPQAADSEVEFIFRLDTQPATNKITVTMDTQDKDKCLAIDFVISDRNPSLPTMLVRTGVEGAAVENKKLSEIVKRCMSIPVTLYAIVKSPQLLDDAAAFFLTNYLQSIQDFDSQLISSNCKREVDPSTGGIKLEAEDNKEDVVAMMDVEYGITTGLKRKRADGW